MAVRWKRVFLLTVVVLMAVIIFAPPVFAAPDSGQVSTAIESTWKTAAGQIKTVTNNVIFPVVDCVLAILLFVKLAICLLYTSPSPRDMRRSRIPSSA